MFNHSDLRNLWDSHLCPQHSPQVPAHERIHSKCEKSKEERVSLAWRLSSQMARELHWDELWEVFMPRPHLQGGVSLWVIFGVCQLLLKHRTAMNKCSWTMESLLLSSSPVFSPGSTEALTLTRGRKSTYGTEGRAAVGFECALWRLPIVWQSWPLFTTFH